MDKNKEPKSHGGPRPGAGRDPMYNEPAVRIIFSVPKSKAAEIRKKVEAILKKYYYKKPKK